MALRSDGRRYAIVVNQEEQYSVWALDGEPVPAGWRSTGFEGTKDDCLDHIAEVWTDMRPRSLRLRMAAAAAETAAMPTND